MQTGHFIIEGAPGTCMAAHKKRSTKKVHLLWTCDRIDKAAAAI